MRDAIKIFKALSDPNRLRILKILQVRPLCVCEITDILALATSTVSKHLSLLRDAGLINDEKDGKWVNYRIDNSGWNHYSAQILSLMATWLNDDALIQADRKKLDTVDRLTICNR
ncbi:MAG: metalloregulator ArsR/SmtB family transcription factor [Lentisphaeria bacterium]|nr:metalloregulator ArsR/SmtB family transcription factor [Candidatus Neomarinimicrobiota bacterium]MCF7842875.1 metalloregulator ArsR/SmtB family transcription factor [Lentisphaeria bacterium]